MIPTFQLGQLGFSRGAAAGGGATDPLFAYVTSLIHFNGTEGSSTFTDQKGISWASSGAGCLIDTDRFKFGGSSGETTGTDRIVATVTSNAFNIAASEPFCIEAWLYTLSGGGSPMPNDQSVSNNFLGLFYDSSTSGRVIIAGSNVLTGITCPGSSWFHYALERKADNTLTAYVDGAAAASTTYSSAIMGNNTISLMGSAVHGGWTGNMDEFRMTKGIARYGGAFTPPAAAFPDA